MLLVAQVREGRRTIPSVTHVDNSARLQTVTREEAPLYYDLIAEFERLTGVPIVINTSFNVRGEPIVCTPHDAYLCFMRTNMDHLVLGHHLLDKRRQPPLREDVDCGVCTSWTKAVIPRDFRRPGPRDPPRLRVPRRPSKTTLLGMTEPESRWEVIAWRSKGRRRRSGFSPSCGSS